MRHTIKLCVSRRPGSGTISCRSIMVREKLMRLLFGKLSRVTVIVPGGSVEEIAICKVGKEGDEDDQGC
ncbi:MAG: hypothetical protein HUJ76_02895 [Parasporobacterium sp.]|nr:hypothetical protein [Parasporobacterium sp.]